MICRSSSFSALSACIEIGTFWTLSDRRVAVTMISSSTEPGAAAAAAAAVVSTAADCARAGDAIANGVKTVVAASKQERRTFRLFV